MDTDRKGLLISWPKTRHLSNVPWAVLGDSYSREAAYALNAKIDTEAAGNGPSQYAQNMPILFSDIWSNGLLIDTPHRSVHVCAVCRQSLIMTAQTRAFCRPFKKVRITCGIISGYRQTSFCYQIFMDGKMHHRCTGFKPADCLSLRLALQDDRRSGKYPHARGSDFCRRRQRSMARPEGKQFSQNPIV